MLSSTPTPSRLPGLRSSITPTPLAERPWPDATVAQGRLVAGFPTPLGPVEPSEVSSSSVSPAGAEMQVALTAATRRSPDAVLRTYRGRMTSHGLREVRADAVGGSEAVGFRRGRTSVVVTVRRTGRKTDYTVYGVVHDGQG